MDKSFVDARDELESAGRCLEEKSLSATEAIRLVKDGDIIAVGGCLYSRTPMALLLEILRQGQKDLSLSRCLTCYEGELFLASGQSSHIITSWMGMGGRWGTSRVLRSMVEAGEAEFEEWSHLGIGMRYRAAAMGVPFLPMLSMLGSDLAKGTRAKVISCPFTGQPLSLVPALFPDVALVHVHRADRFGNAQIDGYRHMDVDLARGARTVILSAEEIVDSERFEREPERTAIPHFVVDAVVPAPFGSFPHECYGLYEADYAHFDVYAELARSGPDGVRRYLDEYVLQTTSFGEFLNRFDFEASVRAVRGAKELVF